MNTFELWSFRSRSSPESPPATRSKAGWMRLLTSSTRLERTPRLCPKDFTAASSAVSSIAWASTGDRGFKGCGLQRLPSTGLPILDPSLRNPLSNRRRPVASSHALLSRSLSLNRSQNSSALSATWAPRITPYLTSCPISLSVTTASPESACADCAAVPSAKNDPTVPRTARRLVPSFRGDGGEIDMVVPRRTAMDEALCSRPAKNRAMRIGFTIDETDPTYFYAVS
mmetsp:Transcript_12867/g.25392  ORF Transcript_12867/g.25392 Transcript_12867/m.25392 type:complete len:227 (-) Transcript_12867:38-718(-)